MSKQLIFRYGTMNSGKSIDILKVAHNYEEQNKKVMLFTHGVDDRYGKGKITSRIGISKEAEIINNRVFYTVKDKNPDCVILDEAHFCSEFIINELARIVVELNIPVICYGLRTDFTGVSFTGSKRLMEIAHKLEEIKTMCWYSNHKATMNIRLLNDKPVFNGEQIKIGGNESYVPVCLKCYLELKENA